MENAAARCRSGNHGMVSKIRMGFLPEAGPRRALVRRWEVGNQGVAACGKVHSDAKKVPSRSRKGLTRGRSAKIALNANHGYCHHRFRTLLGSPAQTLALLSRRAKYCRRLPAWMWWTRPKRRSIRCRSTSRRRIIARWAAFGRTAHSTMACASGFPGINC